jgi:hypothetical protein
LFSPSAPLGEAVSIAPLRVSDSAVPVAQVASPT